MKRVRTTQDDLERIVGEYKKLHTSTYETYGIPIDDKIFMEKILWYSDVVMHFTNCIFSKGLTLLQVSHDEDIFYKDCYFLDDVSFIDCSLTKRVVLLSCKIKTSFLTTGGYINSLTLFLSQCTKLILGETKYDSVEIGGIKISLIKDLHFSMQCIEKIRISNSIIYKLSVNNASSKGELNISDCLINSLGFSGFRNNGVVKIIKCKAFAINQKCSHLTIENSNMGKAEFFQFNFASFDEINIRNSILYECEFVNTKWADNITSFSGDQADDYGIDRVGKRILVNRKDKKYSSTISLKMLKETKEHLENKRDVYKQIKYALSKKGDFVNEQFFHGLEMREYSKTLSFFSKSFFTKLTLKLSYQTSDFGQSLGRPIIWLLLGHSFLFAFVFFLNGFNQISTQTHRDSAKLFEAYFMYINPLRAASISLSGFFIIIDLAMRIWSSYMIYNFVRASRRFIK